MNSDKPDTWGILSLFPLVYYGLAVSYSFFHIFALGDYESKDGQWGSFKVYLLIGGIETFFAFMGYLIGAGLLKTAVQQLPRRTLYLLMTASAFLSKVVYIVMSICARDADFRIHLGGLFLIPALVVVWLIKIVEAGHQPIPR